MKYLSVAEIARKWNLTDRSVRKYCQDGNGRVGRLIMFKECLKHNITPFIIDEQHKMFYYRGLKEWNNKKGFLRDTVFPAKTSFMKYLNILDLIMLWICDIIFYIAFFNIFWCRNGVSTS